MLSTQQYIFRLKICTGGGPKLESSKREDSRFYVRCAAPSALRESIRYMSQLSEIVSNCVPVFIAHLCYLEAVEKFKITAFEVWKYQQKKSYCSAGFVMPPGQGTLESDRCWREGIHHDVPLGTRPSHPIKKEKETQIC